ncbi:MAG: DUF3823 domain-containing protein [Bacteroidales bacterium]
MKRIKYFSLLCVLLSFGSCELFEMDNYEAPGETLTGKVIDIATGNPVLTDQGSEGIRVRLTELSWGPNVQHNPDFFCMSDGTFQNTKLFKGHYHIRVDGPFIPLIREDERGIPLADESKEAKIKGVTNIQFEVQPFLNVEFVGHPMVSNGKITAKIRVNRGVSEEEFRNKIEPMGGYKESFQNVTDVQFFVSYSSSVGYRARDERWSNKIEYGGSSFNSLLGETITIKSNGNIPSGRKVYVRAAARINYDTPAGSGTRRWNYSAPMEVLIP